jgi:hypothetical protein
MSKKKCGCCKIEFDASEFHKSSVSWDGLQGTCKSCKNIKSKEMNLRKKYVDFIFNTKDKYCITCDTTKSISKFNLAGQTKDFLARRCIECYTNKINCIGGEEDTLSCSICEQIHHVSHFSKATNSLNGFRPMCRKCYNQITKDSKRDYDKAYRDKNLAVIKIKKSLYKKNNRHKLNYRYKNDKLYAVACSIRSRIRDFFLRNNKTKSKNTLTVLGCTYIEICDIFESMFDENMTWKNKGSYWHIDHVIPLSFGENEEELNTLSHYTNLRPLEAAENISKFDKVLDDVIRNHFKGNESAPPFLLYLSKLSGN